VLNRKFGTPKQTVAQIGSSTLLLPDPVAKRMGLSMDPANMCQAPWPKGMTLGKPTADGVLDAFPLLEHLREEGA
jgi:hypothetical protein